MNIPNTSSLQFGGFGNNNNNNVKTEIHFGMEWVFFSPDQLLPCFLISNRSNTKLKIIYLIIFWLGG